MNREVKMSYKKITFLLIVILTSVSFAFAASPIEVKNKIADKAKIEGLQIREENGKVMLEGLASTLWDKTQAEKIASKELKTPVINLIAIQSTPKSDRDLVLDITARVRSESSNYLFNLLSVEAHNGNVIFHGKVRDAYLRDVAIESAMQTPGVSSVIDQIQILPTSIGDDRLRAAIFERLTRDIHLYNYFLSSGPSINIIVEGGRVTLVGNVYNNVDKVRAGLIASGTNGVLSVNNQLDVG
jgi:Predicted periplasmic or secreted lipoprotein